MYPFAESNAAQVSPPQSVRTATRREKRVSALETGIISEIQVETPNGSREREKGVFLDVKV